MPLTDNEGDKLTRIIAGSILGVAGAMSGVLFSASVAVHRGDWYQTSLLLGAVFGLAVVARGLFMLLPPWKDVG